MHDAFWTFVYKISLYPTIIFTGLVMFVTLYWIVSLLGMANMDSVDVGGDVVGEMGDTGGDVADLSATGLFTGLLLRMGLYGVPLIIILSLVSLIGWILSYLYTSFLHQHIQSGVLYYVFGTGAFFFVLVISMWLTGLIISPLRKNALNVPKRNAASNIGKIAVVRTLTVTPKHGEAELNDGGAGLILKIRQTQQHAQSTDASTFLKQGDKVVLIRYLEDINAYEVIPTDDD